MHRAKTPGRHALPVALSLALLQFGCSSGGKGQVPPQASPVVAIGEQVPDFTLRDTDGIEHRLSGYIGGDKMIVLEWFNPDCPFIKKHHQANKTMNELYDAFHDRVLFFAVNSGAPGMQGNGLERNRAAKAEYAMGYPILLDEGGDVGRLFHAKTTPHLFVIQKDGKLAYEGALDDDPSPTTLGRTNYVRAVIEQSLAGKTISVRETKPYGCSVKYGRVAG